MTWHFERSWAPVSPPPAIHSLRLPGQQASSSQTLPEGLRDAGWFDANGVLVADQAFHPGLARRCEREIRALTNWERQSRAYVGDGDPIDIPECRWASHPHRAALHDFYPGLSAELTGAATRGLQQFIGACVLGRHLRSWLCAALGLALGDRSSFELVRYHRGDQIRPHRDLIEGRMFAVNWYLDSRALPGEGSDLVVHHDDGRSWTVEPLFNRLAVLPIHSNMSHEVTPRRSDRIGRYTASIGIYGPGY